jgi:hypothetical protein
MKFLLLALLITCVVLICVQVRSTEYFSPHPKPGTPKILHLVLYSGEYKQMYDATRGFYAAQNIPTYYYSFSPNISSEYLLQDDQLLIRGTESYLPGILDKTLKALRYFPLDQYQYIIRSNASTVIDFEPLLDELSRNPVDYAGSFAHELQWLDTGNGITDRTYWGTRYASGTCIILSRDAATKLLNHTLDHKVIDDVAIGVAMKQLGYSPKCFLSRFKAVTAPDRALKRGRWWFYRHRTDNRLNDAQHIKWLTKTLIPSLS